jgi:hypothetical protein
MFARRFTVALAAASLLGLVAVGAVSAHSGNATLSCVEGTPTLHVEGSNYPDGSTVSFGIDGESPVVQNANGSSDLSAGDPFTGHTATVDFLSSDQQSQFDFHFDLSVDPCQQETPPPNPPTVNVSDCDTIGGQGSINVSGLSDGYAVVVEPGDLLITSDGSTPLDPGQYQFEVRLNGADQFGDTLTVGDCPSPTPAPSTCPGQSFQPEAAVQPTINPCLSPSPTSSVASSTATPKATVPATSVESAPPPPTSNANAAWLLILDVAVLATLSLLPTGRRRRSR